MTWKLADISMFESLDRPLPQSPISVFNGTAWARYVSSKGSYIIQAIPTKNKNFMVYSYAPVTKAKKPKAWRTMGYQAASNRGTVTEAFSRTQGPNLSRLTRGGTYQRKLPDLTTLSDETFAQAMNNVRFYGQLLNWIPGEYVNSKTAQFQREHPIKAKLYQFAEKLAQWAVGKRQRIDSARNPATLLKELSTVGSELTPYLGKGMDIGRAISLLGKVVGDQQYKDNVYRTQTQELAIPGTRAESTF